MNRNKNIKKISVFLAAIMVVSVLAVSIDVFSLTPPAGKVENPVADSSDEQIACDISNVTGIKVEVLLSERSKGKAWNEILGEARQEPYEKGSSSRQRDNTLSLSAVGENELNQLKKEGFDDEEIQQAGMLVERVLFQLQEITAGGIETDNSFPGVKLPGDNENNAMEKYREIISKFEAAICLKLILRLQDDFGGMEKAMDEYLFCLQAGLELTLYIADRDEYLRLREEKSTLLNSVEAITMAKIEEKMLDSLRKRNESAANDGAGTAGVLPGAGSNEALKTQTNDVPLPDETIVNRKNTMPENPADSIQKEIDILDPMKTVDGGLNR